MPRISFWTIFVLFGIVSRWAEKALEDRKITLVEAAELAEDLGPILGVPVEIEIPAPEPPKLETSAGEETETAPPEHEKERSPPESPTLKADWLPE